MEFPYEVIICIVNTGFSDLVMDAARSAGARGGTVINARGTADEEAQQLFNISLQPEKELVMIIVKSEIRDTVLHLIYKEAGLDTPARGIAFSMPSDNAVGLTE